VDMQEEEIIEEKGCQNILHSKGLIPVIFDGYDLNLPSFFNVVTIHLDGKLLSNLNWEIARELARKAVSKGYAIFWNIDLGLFDHLILPLSNQTQFLSLGLSLDHFKTFLWQEFADHSLGVSIFRGNADFSLDFCWDIDQIVNLRNWIQGNFRSPEELSSILQDLPLAEIQPGDLCATEYGKNLLALFCRDVCVEYLSMLASTLPHTIPCYLFLDATSFFHDLTKQIRLLNPERFEFFNLALKGTSLPFNSLGWHSHATVSGYVGAILREIPESTEIQIGVCLPLMNYYGGIHWNGLNVILKHLLDRGLRFRIISESHLITQWDGLNFLFYNPDGLSPQGKRKLQGFCAAGGEVISVGEPLGLPDEISLQEWLVQCQI